MVLKYQQSSCNRRVCLHCLRMCGGRGRTVDEAERVSEAETTRHIGIHFVTQAERHADQITLKNVFGCSTISIRELESWNVLCLRQLLVYVFNLNTCAFL